MERHTQFNIWYLILAIVGVPWLRELWVNAQQVEPIPYSDFQQQLQAGRIKDIAIANNFIQGTYKDPQPDGRTRFVTTRVDPELARDLEQYNVRFTGVIENTLLRDMPGWIVPALVFFGIWMFGHLSFEEERAPFLPSPDALTQRKYSEDTARAIDRAARDFSGAAFTRAVAILAHNRTILEQGTRELRHKETLNESEIRSIAQSLARPPY